MTYRQSGGCLAGAGGEAANDERQLPGGRTEDSAGAAARGRPEERWVPSPSHPMGPARERAHFTLPNQLTDTMTTAAVCRPAWLDRADQNAFKACGCLREGRQRPAEAVRSGEGQGLHPRGRAEEPAGAGVLAASPVERGHRGPTLPSKAQHSPTPDCCGIRPLELPPLSWWSDWTPALSLSVSLQVRRRPGAGLTGWPTRSSPGRWWCTPRPTRAGQTRSASTRTQHMRTHSSLSREGERHSARDRD